VDLNLSRSRLTADRLPLRLGDLGAGGGRLRPVGGRPARTAGQGWRGGGHSGRALGRGGQARATRPRPVPAWTRRRWRAPRRSRPKAKPWWPAIAGKLRLDVRAGLLPEDKLREIAALKAVFLVTTLVGITGLWPAILEDTGATVLVTLNALRLLRWRFAAPEVR